MAIQTVNIGAIVNDGTGDPLRTAYSKLNDNFTDTANAASKLVQTSPTDTTAGALMAVGAFGIGGNVTNVSDADNAQGLTQLFGNSGLSKPNYPTVGIHAGLNIRGVLDINSQLLITQTDTVGSNTDPEVFVRNTNISGGDFRPWIKFYTGANLNPNVFGGDGADVIAVGLAVSSTQVAFHLPVSFNSNPSSITEVGTFTVRDAAGANYGTGLSSFSLSGLSSHKIARVLVNTVGLTANNSYELQLDSAASKITVNL